MLTGATPLISASPGYWNCFTKQPDARSCCGRTWTRESLTRARSSTGLRPPTLRTYTRGGINPERLKRTRSCESTWLCSPMLTTFCADIARRLWCNPVLKSKGCTLVGSWTGVVDGETGKTRLCAGFLTSSSERSFTDYASAATAQVGFAGKQIIKCTAAMRAGNNLPHKIPSSRNEGDCT